MLKKVTDIMITVHIKQKTHGIYCCCIAYYIKTQDNILPIFRSIYLIEKEFMNELVKS